jgi:hypothetical protein
VLINAAREWFAASGLQRAICPWFDSGLPVAIALQHVSTRAAAEILGVSEISQILPAVHESQHSHYSLQGSMTQTRDRHWYSHPEFIVKYSKRWIMLHIWQLGFCLTPRLGQCIAFYSRVFCEYERINSREQKEIGSTCCKMRAFTDFELVRSYPWFRSATKLSEGHE